MKKTIITAMVLSFLGSALAMAQEGDGRHSRGEGGGPGFGNSGGFTPKSQPMKRQRPQNTKRRSNRNGNVGIQQGFNNSTPHRFNQPGKGNTDAGAYANNSHQSFNSAKSPNRTVPSNLRQMGVRHLPPTMGRNRILNTPPEHSSITTPHMGPSGESLHASVIEPRSTNAMVIRSHMNSFTQNTAVMAQINVYNTHETVANHYYWHTWNGMNYCHYYDPWGYHWYGWYWGNTCFWSRWYYNHWWWYDPVAYRWCYWYDGWWWWNDPSDVSVVYVYNNGQYNSAPSNGDNTAVSPTGGNAPTAPANPTSEIDYKSKDGTRTVKIMGDDAFLYDTADGASDNKPFYLGSGVKDVQFSRTDNGQPLRIRLTFDDGTSKTFDSDGNPIGDNSN